MASNKIQRINEDIQRTLYTLLRNVKDPRVKQGLLSVTAVDTTADLRYAKVYISIFGDVEEKEIKKGLKSASGYLRRELGQSIKLRYTPELIFEIDKSIAHGAHISKLLNELDIAEEEKTDA
ncbi:MAG: 30S ribosome-binding factor RbfA [Clostridiales bacterium]|nr:30S ribosome-binding factor RbfA [Clostridiales bacterium]